jgi:hypothetical protein
MKNLLAETIEAIAQNDHTMSWEQAESRLNVDYDAGYGGQEIATDLVVVFADGSWLERGEYDGSEWWVYKCAPQRHADAAAFAKVRLNGLMANETITCATWEQIGPALDAAVAENRAHDSRADAEPTP